MYLKQLDENSKKYLHILYKKGYAKIPTFTANIARNIFSSTSHIFEANRVIKIEHQKKIPLHIYNPSGTEPTSIIIFFHSGGFVLRQWSINSSLCKKIADVTHSCVILVEYSLSPEEKFPKAIYEASTVIEWVHKNKKQLMQYDNIYLCGESSGANLAIAALINSKFFNINGLILICPSLDYYNQYKSKEEFSSGYLLDKDVRLWFRNQYLNNPIERIDPLVSPLMSDQLHRLSNVLIINSYFDPLRDESIEFKNKLDQCGVKNRIETFDTIHGFFSLNIKPFSNNVLNIIDKFINRIV